MKYDCFFEYLRSCLGFHVQHLCWFLRKLLSNDPVGNSAAPCAPFSSFVHEVLSWSISEEKLYQTASTNCWSVEKELRLVGQQFDPFIFITKMQWAQKGGVLSSLIEKLSQTYTEFASFVVFTWLVSRKVYYLAFYRIVALHKELTWFSFAVNITYVQTKTFRS